MFDYWTTGTSTNGHLLLGDFTGVRLGEADVGASVYSLATGSVVRAVSWTAILCLVAITFCLPVCCNASYFYTPGLYTPVAVLWHAMVMTVSVWVTVSVAMFMLCCKFTQRRLSYLVVTVMLDVHCGSVDLCETFHWSTLSRRAVWCDDYHTTHCACCICKTSTCVNYQSSHTHRLYCLPLVWSFK